MSNLAFSLVLTSTAEDAFTEEEREGLIHDLKEKGIVHFLRSYLASGPDGTLASLRKLLLGLGIVPVSSSLVPYIPYRRHAPTPAQTPPTPFHPQRGASPISQGRPLAHPPQTLKVAPVQHSPRRYRFAPQVEKDHRPLRRGDLDFLRDTRF